MLQAVVAFWLIALATTSLLFLAVCGVQLLRQSTRRAADRRAAARVRRPHTALSPENQRSVA